MLRTVKVALILVVVVLAWPSNVQAAEGLEPWWGSEDPWLNWHMGVRAGGYRFLSLDQGTFDRAYMVGLFYQTPMIEASNFKFEFALEYGDAKGDETIFVPQWLRDQFRPVYGSVVDSQIQSKWTSSFLQFKATAMWYPVYDPGDPGYFQPFVFGGMGWAGHEIDQRIEADMPLVSRSIQVDSDTDNVLFAEFGAGFQFAFHPRCVFDFRIGLDVYTDSQISDGIYYVTAGLAF